ncbi:MAG: HAMP domain-containing protein [Planctomycetes bacterium]|nr:HAMP domain-containing protein [Planctomycetota bacterium]MBL7143194.1 HAMP domain-containing protein [Phycisphaerae bacterium]
MKTANAFRKRILIYRIYIKHIWQKLLKLLRLSPVSLAKKCRITFGAAVVFILTIALLLPYIWMGQLIKKDLLDTGRARSQTLLDRHFQLKNTGQTTLPLSSLGLLADVNDSDIRWIRFTPAPAQPEGDENKAASIEVNEKISQTIESLKNNPTQNDKILLNRETGVLRANYVRIFRATDNCLTCHNPQGSASAFSLNEQIGTVIISLRGIGSEISKTILMNRIWVIVAGLIGGIGAIVVFYWITQRVILRPIRQLRAIANNVTEGNLDIRSAIKTGDEYEKLANAFNNMLDGLQAAQEKLRQANKQLDAKIAELSERNIELFKANKVKGEFLANISHEFRTPLNAILGFAQVLREKPSSAGGLKKDKAQKYAENIISSGNSLLNMINDLLDLAKTQAGKMELHIEKTSVQQLCGELISSFSLMTEKKKIKIKLKVDSDIPLILTDTGKVRQILYNFLSNAVKFTAKRGTIEILAGAPLSSPPYVEKWETEELAVERMVRIAVSDTGCGIAESDREKIFEKFRQVDGSITRESTGTGLGLTISTELAAMLAGNVGLQSELNKGSTFWLDIPITLTKEPSV